ncbi:MULTISPECIES: monovalent cation/H+ antiporter subunit D family protein [Methanothrix]|jgi:multicomponent Na+:H+ antiporter subunit D|uniref:Monovalent cation/H+ antiporter subunit D family protein n=5 Tax=root TaxID=1 RepID=A0A7K4AIA9_METSH|nr:MULTISPECIES: monovalent cation/H+ antiporter subunit D family protein [Methanothrix]MBP7067581.1 monovalent cation/H+ antiporter subunit D family protein [Methanothrix sp.]MDD3550686.1 monovalent cation/H+ antiporter subunit D family protein [Methanothrix soehngenii]MDY0412482.1 monovalent cation/H+ antiporter subunit D family protein [Methanothrix soehngenii]NLJ22693.1 monovalent cation/H+ antiporter subunit D family protein [Methanothrix soehngenii]UEC40641.1 MAG: NADH-quinone oxidoreduc
MYPVEHFPVLIVGLALFCGFTMLLAGYTSRRLPFFMSLAMNSVFLIMSLFILDHVLTVGPIRYWLGGWRPPWGIEYVVDAMNAYLLIIVISIVILGLIYSRGNVRHEIEERKHVTFYTLVQLMAAGMYGITVTGDLFNMFIWLEIASLTAYALIAVAGGRALRPAYNYVIMGSIGAVLYIFGVGWIYSVTGTLNFADMRLLLPLVYDSRAVQMGFAMIVVGVMIKAYIFPLHLWQPDVYTYAPSTISSMMASVHVKVMFYMLLRMFYSVFTLDFIRHYIGLDLLICWVAAIAILAGSIWAIKQRNLKRMLAYSSVSQMGYILLGLGLSPLSPWGLVGVAAHILNHAIGKGCLFMCAGAISQQEGLRDIRDFEGLGKKMPHVCAAFTIAALSMIGIPLTAGFASKLFLIVASLDAAQYPFVAVLLLSGLLNLVYFWRVIDQMYFVKHKGTENAAEVRETGKSLPLSMVAPILILASLCIIMGIIWLTNIPMPLINHILSNLRMGVTL